MPFGNAGTREEKLSATLRDIANQAGVAESTVSRALSGHGAIAEGTRLRIHDIADRLGYSRSKRPSNEPHERRGIVGVVVAALRNSFYPFLIERIHDELNALGFDMILIIDDLSDTVNLRKMQGLIDSSLDGVILATASIRSPAVDHLVSRGIPTVLAIRSNKTGNADVVESDNLATGTEAVRHLLDLGHRNIGFLLGPRDTSTSMDRYTGGCRELRTAGIAPVPPENVIWGTFSHDSGYSGLVQLMNLPKPPTAILCGNDVIAIGALEACQKLGIRIPGDVSIVGVDDIPMAGWSMISLTTIRQSVDNIGAIAARRVVARIEGRADDSPSHDILPTSIVRRRTTGPAAGGARNRSSNSG